MDFELPGGGGGSGGGMFIVSAASSMVLFDPRFIAESLGNFTPLSSTLLDTTKELNPEYVELFL